MQLQTHVVKLTFLEVLEMSGNVKVQYNTNPPYDRYEPQPYTDPISVEDIIRQNVNSPFPADKTTFETTNDGVKITFARVI